VEALDVLQAVLAKNFLLCALDLSGSGQSEGEFISLGHFEQLDLQVVIKHLRDKGVRLLGVWGRSMGAATAILRAAEDWSISALVLDSPFSNLSLVAQELVNSQIALPDFLVTMALNHVRSEIQARASFDIEELRPLRSAPRARSPAVFGVATDDDFVLPHHTYDLHQAWGAEAKLLTFNGGHNGSRPKWFLEQAADFLAAQLVDTLPSAPNPGSVSKPRVELQSEDVVPPPRVEVSPVSQVSPPAGSSRAVTAQLHAMGFSEDIATDAAQRFTSVEAAMEWALEESTKMAKESAQALDSLVKKLAAPKGAGAAITAISQVEAASAAAGRALEGKLGSLTALSELTGRGLPAVAAVSADLQAHEDEGDLVGQLLTLGFPLPRARDAADRCSTVEGAVAWLTETA